MKSLFLRSPGISVVHDGTLIIIHNSRRFVKSSGVFFSFSARFQAGYSRLAVFGSGIRHPARLPGGGGACIGRISFQWHPGECSLSGRFKPGMTFIGLQCRKISFPSAVFPVSRNASHPPAKRDPPRARRPAGCQCGRLGRAASGGCRLRRRS